MVISLSLPVGGVAGLSLGDLVKEGQEKASQQVAPEAIEQSFLELFAWGDTGWGDEIATGFGLTAALSISTLPIGIILGFCVAGLSLSRAKVLRVIGVSYSTVFRGLPELLTLFLVYNGVNQLLNSITKSFDANASFVEISPFAAGVTALGLVFGAFSGEVLRGAIQALDKGQIEAGFAVGMNRWTVFYRIMLPHIWRLALPGLGNLWVNLIKDTALVSVIALEDLLRMTNLAVATTKLPFTFYCVACFAYWIVCFASERVIARMELRVGRGFRRA
jgi:polar amino acid transport system permease protein